MATRRSVLGGLSTILVTFATGCIGESEKDNPRRQIPPSATFDAAPPEFGEEHRRLSVQGNPGTAEYIRIYHNDEHQFRIHGPTDGIMYITPVGEAGDTLRAETDDGEVIEEMTVEPFN